MRQPSPIWHGFAKRPATRGDARELECVLTVFVYLDRYHFKERPLMSVYSIWESRFPAEPAEEGVKVTKAIWRDMLCFDGYLSHELIQDLDQPGPLFVVSRWGSAAAGGGGVGAARG